MKSGWLYVLGNAHMGGVVKIGQTERSPKERADELSAATGVPTPFVLVWYESVCDVVSAEREVHAALRDHRVNVGREFFRIDVKDAIQAVSSIASRFAVPATEPVVRNFEEQWEKDDQLLMAARQLVEEKKREEIQERDWLASTYWPPVVDPRALRIALEIDVNESRVLFQKLQDLGLIDSAGRPI